MRTTEQEILDELKDADGERDVLNAISMLRGEPRTPESVVIMGTASCILYEQLSSGNNRNV